MTRHPKGTTFSHYRTHAGAEVDLVLENPSGETVALEIKRTLSPKLTPGFQESMKTLQSTKGYYIIPPRRNLSPLRIRDRHQPI